MKSGCQRCRQVKHCAPYLHLWVCDDCRWVLHVGSHPGAGLCGVGCHHEEWVDGEPFWWLCADCGAVGGVNWRDVLPGDSAGGVRCPACGSTHMVEVDRPWGVVSDNGLFD